MENHRPAGLSGGIFHRAIAVVGLVYLLALLSACQSPSSRPSPATLPESQGVPSATAAVFSAPATITSNGTVPGITVETPALASPTEFQVSTATPIPFGSCTNGLTYLGDLTFPDRTKVLPGQPLEKSWKVRNSGQCDWGPEYRFRWTGGTHLASQDEFALYPAAAGSEAALVIPMIAPTAPGEYTSDWRAFSPLGVPFGDSLYIDIIVAP